MIGILSPGKLYFDSNSRTSSFDEFEQFGIVHHIALVQVHDERGHADLACQQDVLAGSAGIGPSAADTTRIAPSICAAPVIMFLHIVGVAGAIDVRVMPVLGLVFDMGGWKS